MKWTIIEHGRKPELTHVPRTLLRGEQEIARDMAYLAAIEFVATECLDDDQITEISNSGRESTYTGRRLRAELARIRAFDEGRS
jgi:hypothetical protein